MTTIILPGMGADSTMYPEKHFSRLTGISFAEWPEYKNESSIQAVAERVIEEYVINKKMIVGGSSLGGVVAIQIAKITGIKKVILIGSATHPKYINPMLQKLSVISGMAPVKFLQFLAGKINYTGKSVISTMFEKSDSRFIKAMPKALLDWEGIGGYKGIICHIHGQLDRVIYPPCSNVEIIPAGGHVISMTHGEVVAQYIKKNTN